VRSQPPISTPSDLPSPIIREFVFDPYLRMTGDAVPEAQHRERSEGDGTQLLSRWAGDCGKTFAFMAKISL
jgi:hypothetical protein